MRALGNKPEMDIQYAVEVCRRSSFFGCNILMANHSKELNELIGVKVQIFGLPAKCEGFAKIVV